MGLALAVSLIRAFIGPGTASANAMMGLWCTSGGPTRRSRSVASAELGETEHHLLLDPAAADGLLVYPVRGPCAQRLAGIVVLHELAATPGAEIPVKEPQANPGVTFQLHTISQALNNSLPEYMVPNAWIALAYLPQSASHKADRRRLTDWLEEMSADEFTEMTRGLTERVVEDAAPVTDAQSYFVEGALAKRCDSLHYFVIDGNGCPDVNHWKASILALIEHHEILRTAYAFYNEELLQLVLDSSTRHPDIALFETNSSMGQFTEIVIGQDMHRPLQLGRLFAEFAIITDAKEDRHRILFRLSHGEFGRMALSYFMETLREIYNGTAVSEYTPFCQHMYHLLSEGQKDSMSYWRSLLHGSSMPVISSTSKNQTLEPRARRATVGTRQVPITQELPAGITQAIAMQAAWAVIVARKARTWDVLFGVVASGRYSEDSSATRKTAGCCANIVPARAILDPSRTVINLCHQLSEQYLSRMPHEGLGFRQILDGCGHGDGSRPSGFTSRLNHLQHKGRWPVSLGGTDSYLELVNSDGVNDPLPVVDIASYQGTSHVEVAMEAQPTMIEPEEAEMLFRIYVGLLKGPWLVVGRRSWGVFCSGIRAIFAS
ncbi:hypothetical protein BDW74DRAFT_176206 [Aspergillus multicolor]|uniref:uncharacterized protein n=1 Tax=Aspergillus multicolor TaxID=41759 RepID=UPI003CCD6EE2